MCEIKAIMRGLIPYTLNIHGCLMDLSEPKVTGILNVTPDSFYEGSRRQTAQAIRERADEMLAQGADILDIGACSTRPGSDPVSPEEEQDRLDRALSVIREHHPNAVLSVDTFRASIARHCVETYGVEIVNDVYGGDMDPAMFETVAGLGVPYVLTHAQKVSPASLQEAESQPLVPRVMKYFANRIARLHELGQNDIILDPGFGFAKTLDQNYELMNKMEALQAFNLPLLVGISRKSMIYKLLDTTPEEALNGTTVLNTLALTKGASILRVHDVKACVETIKIVRKCLTSA